MLISQKSNAKKLDINRKSPPTEKKSKQKIFDPKVKFIFHRFAIYCRISSKTNNNNNKKKKGNFDFDFKSHFIFLVHIYMQKVKLDCSTHTV